MGYSGSLGNKRIFLLASFLWLVSYVAICLLIVDPWQLDEVAVLHGALIWFMSASAAGALVVALWWGIKELQRSEISAAYVNEARLAE